MGKPVLYYVFWIAFSVTFKFVICGSSVVTIGVLLEDLASQINIPLNSTIYKKNMVDHRVLFSTKIMQVSGKDNFEDSQTLCNILKKDRGVIAVYSDAINTIPILESTCTHFEVPFITTSWRNPSPPKKEADAVVPALLNFFPEAELYAKGLAEVVKSLQWSSFIIIYETEEGLIQMQEILKLQELNPSSKKNNIIVMQLGTGDDYRPLLKKIRNTTEDNIILNCRTEKILPVLKQAKSLGMLKLHNRYFLTSMDAHTLDFSALNTTANITTIRLHDPKSDDFLNTIQRWELTEFANHNKRVPLDPLSIKTETVLFHDAILLLTDTINAMSIKPGISHSSLMCNGSDVSDDGFTLRNYLLINTPSLTLTGPIKFNEQGERVDFNINVVDIIDDTLIATWFASNNSLILGRNYNQTVDAAISNLQKVMVIVSSRIGEPYLMHREPTEGEILTGNNRYEGYSMDLIAGIAKIIGFNFQFEITEKYGNYDKVEKRWNGLIREVLEKRAHLAICDLTITPERREVVDFSMPFMTLGIGILHKMPDKGDVNMFGFLDPFSPIVWIYTATLYLIISIVLFFISRMTPGDWENPHPCEENPEELENIWDVKNCLWLTLGSIMTQGCDILPKGISSRLAVGMWWFFSLIMTSSYTANLAAFLTKANLESPIDGAEALSKQTKIKYGCLANGATESFFKNSNYSTYQRMWMNMQTTKPSVFEDSNAEGVQRVRTTKNGLYAFLIESTQIEYETETKCDLKQIGKLLDSKSFGIAMPMNSPYRSAINRAVLKLQESGELGELKKKWWKLKRKEKSCEAPSEEEDSLKLGLANVGGVFLVLGIGIGMSCLFAILEFLWNCRNISVQEHISYMHALKIELKFACNIFITKKRVKPLLSENGSSQRSDDEEKNENKSIIQGMLQSIGSNLNITQ